VCFEAALFYARQRFEYFESSFSEKLAFSGTERVNQGRYSLFGTSHEGFSIDIAAAKLG